MFMGLILAACSPRTLNLSNNTLLVPTTIPTISKAETPFPTQASTAKIPPLSSLPDNLAKISAENIQKITELSTIFPDIPPFYHFSEDGSRVAIGDTQKVEIRDVSSGEIISSIPATLPECDFGFDRFFRLNSNGSLIALVNGQSVQVWNVKGEKIYETPLFHGFGSNAPTCGADIPEMALSPDGKLLAVSGMTYSKSSVKRFFKVIDIVNDSVLYDWNGRKETLHGALYSYYGLGFSDDGKLLQTFDPVRFILSEGNLNQAFRFWSVGDWQEVDRNSPTIIEGFSTGKLLFPLSNSGIVEIQSKVNGEITATIRLDGCAWDTPCETRFSHDGERAAVLSRGGEKIQFRSELLRTAISIWDLSNDQETSSISGQFRNLEGVLIKDDGSVINAAQMISGDKRSSGWWTFKEDFNGLQTNDSGYVTFVPLAAAADETGDCQFCATCSVDPVKSEITCSKGLSDQQGERFFTKTEGEQFFFTKQVGASESILGELALPEKIDLTKTRVRLLGYSSQKQILFYCVDEASRQAGCFIYDADKKKALSEIADISFLRLSPDGSKAAFINRSVNALFTFDLSLKTLARKSAFQSRAYPVNPVFSSDGKNLFYVIQNLNSASDLSVEILDSNSGKITSRVSLKNAGVTAPTVFAIANDNSFWALAEKGGEIAALSPDKGVLLFRWQAHEDEIIGLAINPDQQWMLTMGENNILKIWGVE
jgi:WD40 repeat protein